MLVANPGERITELTERTSINSQTKANFSAPLLWMDELKKEEEKNKSLSKFDPVGIPHICHRHHRRCLCKFFLPGVIFFQIEREKLAFYCIVYNNLRPSV